MEKINLYNKDIFKKWVDLQESSHKSYLNSIPYIQQTEKLFNEFDGVELSNTQNIPFNTPIPNSITK